VTVCANDNQSERSMGRTTKRPADGSTRPAEPRQVGAGELAERVGRWLEVERFADYCPNGLQVEGARPIRRLVSGVTASLALIDAAAEAGADALLVHHGWFWKGEDACLVGLRGERVRRLMASGMSLFAYHLPLDAHPELGNNARLGRVLGLAVAGTGGERDLVWHARLDRPTAAAALGRRIARRLGRRPLAVGALDRPIERVAWCTGAAQDYLEDAIALGADAFISGEISERTTHVAREAGVVYFAAGHHATERYGVQALGEAIAGACGIEHRYIDVPNPV